MTSFSESLFYGGIIGGVITLVLAIAVILLLSIYSRRLSARLDDEYGKPVKKVR